MQNDSRTSFKEKLKELIILELRIPDITPAALSDDEPLFSDRLGLDSIDAVEVVYLVEKHFGVKIRDMKEGRPALQSIETLADFIAARSTPSVESLRSVGG
jgi:acyl carrier protein